MQNTRWGNLTTLQRCSRRILQPCNIKIDQNTEKSPGDLMKIALSDFSKKPSAITGGSNSQGVTPDKIDLAKKGIESLLMAAQNSAIRTNHIKARIDKTQQNSKNRLCGDRDETINDIISECSKLAQKEYKTRHDWVSKVIQWVMFFYSHIRGETIQTTALLRTARILRRVLETRG